MSGQVQKGPPSKSADESESVQVEVVKKSHDVDDILAEIDATLEKNAAAFVSGFVQKGGQ
ncbi:MAG TPA: ubiquitin-like protein Pup [Candidatus Nanopelagicaceae bacterium]|nr:ubiquitin-like protein Pup [Candidatus Nanopelagicaceae bacterium]